MTTQESRVPTLNRASTGQTNNGPERSASTLGSTARLVAGQLLSGRYRIEREIAEGGMGVVYLAADEQVPGERFAVKVLKEGLHPDALMLLRDEVRKTRKLSHPHIVDVHSVNVDGRRLYVLMEYLEGKSLDVLLAEEFGRGMSFSHAWPIIEDLAAALGKAHDHNVIHSDIKPANVFVTTSGRTKLLDFGIARVSRGPLLQARSGPRALTPAYASCEMLEGKEADRRDDIYSFASVIYEMLSGEHPFGDITALEAREAGTRVPPLEGLSRSQNAALAQALAFNRESRTSSVEKLLQGLSAGRPARARNAMQVGAVVLALVAAAGVGYLVFDRLQISQHPTTVDGGFSTDREATAPAPTPPLVGAKPSESIAVLPFVNMSGDPKQEYFSDGLSEELIDHLVHGTGLKVIARTSSFQFKGRNEDVRSIARKLAVTHLLEGSVRQDREQVRITAQLIRASDGAYVWSQTYDRPSAEIFKLQDEIADRVSQALRVAVPRDYSSQARQPDIRAYNLVLEGNYFKARRTLPDVETAVRLYRQAIDVSPNYALAWARLASAYLSVEVLKGIPSAEQSKLVLGALQRAIQIDPKLSWAYYTRGGYELNVTWDWAAARTDTERVREIDPLFDYLPIALGYIAYIFGDFDRAVALYREQLERSPLDPNTLEFLSAALCSSGRLQECLQTRQKTLQLHPEFGRVNSAVAMAHLYLGEFGTALEAMRREPDENDRLVGLALVYAAMGQRPESDAALNALTGKFGSSDPYGIAEVHAYRGEKDAAFGWLDRAYRQHNAAMIVLKADPLLRNLHGDPRFQALLARMKLSGQSQSRGPDDRDFSVDSLKFVYNSTEESVPYGYQENQETQEGQEDR